VAALGRRRFSYARGRRPRRAGAARADAADARAGARERGGLGQALRDAAAALAAAAGGEEEAEVAAATPPRRASAGGGERGC
jgi:hypothetical protein